MSPLIEMYLAWMGLWLLGGSVVVCFLILLGAACRSEPLLIHRHHLIMMQVALGPFCWVASAAFLVLFYLLRWITPSLRSEHLNVVQQASKPLSFHRPEQLKEKE